MTTSSPEPEHESSAEQKQQKKQRSRETPPLGTVSIDNGWRYAPGKGVWYQNPQSGEWVRKLDWCPRVRHVVRNTTQDGQTITKRYEIWVGDQKEVVSLSDLTRGAGLWGRFHGAGVITGRTVADALINIVQHQARQLPDLPGYPMFRDGKLSIPPTSYLPDGYRNGEDTSRAALRNLLKGIAPYGRSCLIMGLSAAAPWVGGLNLQPFTLHLEGNTTCCKSTILTAAAALWGVGFKGIVKTWHGTKISIPGDLRDLGVLPMFRDEISTANLSGPDRAALFSVIMEGAYRSARTRDDLPRPSATWASILFSTGNQACVPEAYLSSGHPKGIIELHGDDANPFIPDSKRIEIQNLTNEPAMSGSWVPFARKLTIDGMRKAWEKAGEDLGGAPEGGLAWHMWRAMALGVAGARALADVTGVREIADQALLEGAAIIDAAPERMVDIRADQGQRLVDAVTEYLSVRPSAFGLGDDAANSHTDQIGFLKTVNGRDLVCVYPTKHDAVAQAAGVEDVAVAHRQLRGDGRLVTSDGQGLGYRVRPPSGKKPVRVYAYDIGGDAMNDLNAMNNAGQDVQTEAGAGMNTASEGYEQATPRCAGCGQMMQVIEEGQQYHPTCEPEPAEPVQEELPQEPEPVTEETPEPETAPVTVPESSPEPVAGPVTPEPDSPAPATSRRTDAGTSDRRKVSDLDPAEELASFTRSMRKRGIGTDATAEEMAAALGLLSEVTGGLRWVSYTGQVGQAAFARMIARHGSMKKPLAMTDTRAVKLCRDDRVTVTRNHVRPGLARKLLVGAPLSGFDVNGQYPNSAQMAELGDGDPEWIRKKPRSLAAVWEKPGYVKVERTIRAAKVPQLKFIKTDGTPPAAGDWLPMPVVRYLGENLGIEVEASEIVWWPNSGRRMRNFIEKGYKKPREALREMPPSPVRDIALSALKVLVNDMIGMLRSERHSSGPWYRPDWNDMITSLSEMNALRAIDKCETPAVVKCADTMYFLAPPPCEACQADNRTKAQREEAPNPSGHVKDCGKPAGLVVSPLQLGKVKLERVAEVTPEIIAAYKDGSATRFHQAVKIAAGEKVFESDEGDDDE